MFDVSSNPPTARWAQWLTAATLAGVAMGIIGPFGTFLNDGVLERMAYWTFLLWVGTLVFGTTIPLAVRWAPRLGLPSYFAVALATALVSVPLAAFVAALGQHLWSRYVLQVTPIEWYAQTLFMSALCVCTAFGLDRLQAQTRRSESVDPAGTSPSVADRASDHAWDQVLCVQMEDHYVRLHRADGSQLVLMPMRDAIASLATVDGLRTHRSWWVARRAVASIRQDGRGLTLQLTNGLEAPVARNRIAELRASGWLSQDDSKNGPAGTTSTQDDQSSTA